MKLYISLCTFNLSYLRRQKTRFIRYHPKVSLYKTTHADDHLWPNSFTILFTSIMILLAPPETLINFRTDTVSVLVESLLINFSLSGFKYMRSILGRFIYELCSLCQSWHTSLHRSYSGRSNWPMHLLNILSFSSSGSWEKVIVVVGVIDLQKKC